MCFDMLNLYFKRFLEFAYSDVLVVGPRTNYDALASSILAPGMVRSLGFHSAPDSNQLSPTISLDAP